MNLIVHQDNCQMVTGNIMRVRVCPGAGEIPGAEDQDFNMGRMCTCEPQVVPLVSSGSFDISQARRPE